MGGVVNVLGMLSTPPLFKLPITMAPNLSKGREGGGSGLRDSGIRGALRETCIALLQLPKYLDLWCNMLVVMFV